MLSENNYLLEISGLPLSQFTHYRQSLIKIVSFDLICNNNAQNKEAGHPQILILRMSRFLFYVFHFLFQNFCCAATQIFPFFMHGCFE